MGLFETTVTSFLLTMYLYLTSTQQNVHAETFADVAFLVDGSQNMGPQAFKQTRGLILKTVSRLNIGKDAYRIGLAQYSYDAVVEFTFNTMITKKDIVNYLKKKFQYRGGTSLKTGLALNFLRNTYFTAAAGSRLNQGIPQIAILITSAPSDDDVETYSASLRNYGVIVISIGVKSSDLNELQKVAYLGHSPFVIRRDKFVGFTNLAVNLTKTIQNIQEFLKMEVTEPPAVSPSPSIPIRPVSPDEPCHTINIAECIVDIAVGFDFPEWFGSQNIFNGQQQLQLKLKELVQGITSASNISCMSGVQPEIRVAFYARSNTGQVIFETKFENYSAEIIQYLTSIQAAAKIDLDLETLEVLGNKFVETNSKAKVLLIFTDGLDGTKESFKKTSKNLREKGVNALITVALENAPDMDDIHFIEFGRGFEYKKKLSIEMEDVASALHRQINAVVDKECCNVPCKCAGEPGTRGFQGRKGDEGNPGAKGFPGYPGDEGGPGDRGLPGINGTHGMEGCAGSPGLKGKSGYPGEKGSDGDHGIDGIAGEQGDHGNPGAPGEKGNTGNLGRKGQKGDIGEHGRPGLRGNRGEFGSTNSIQGPKGERGDTGLSGDPGDNGNPGDAGPAGKPGLHGHRGPPGKNGRNGKPGKRGRKGFRGVRGPQGLPGSPGPVGRKGEQGARGQQGPSESPGQNGIDGIPGLKGKNGEPGHQGEKGERGPTGSRGLMGMDGKDGIGPQGQKGKKGDRGPRGNFGRKGEDGIPGQNGERGAKGMRGNRGNAGDSGDLGERGAIGYDGPKGPRGPWGTPFKPCDLISIVRANCPCCSQRKDQCPVYPTELAFALDASSDVTLSIFERMKGIVLKLLQYINIAESNCPSGARVAVLTYNNVARPFIRFSDFKRKQLLIKEIEELAHERSTRRRSIGVGMQFVARHTFKRVRNGVLVRKIAVFITNGDSKDTSAIAIAASQFSALDIIPVIISLKDTPGIQQAFKVNGEDKAQVIVLPSQQQVAEELLEMLVLCTLCFDECERYSLCFNGVQPAPLPVNMEMVFVVDDLQQMNSTQSDSVQHFITSMVNTFLSTTEPTASGLHPRVALLQHTSNYSPRHGRDPINLEFRVLDYALKTLKKRHIQEPVSQPEGTTGIASSISWSLKNFFSNLTNPQAYKVIFTIFSRETSIDGKKLLEISQEAKCKGFTLFALALGEVSNVTFLEEFVSFPFDQHLVQLDKGLEAEIKYAQKFAVAFLKNLPTEINSYPPPHLAKKCRGTESQETVKEAEKTRSYSIELVVVADEVEQPLSYTNNNDMCALNFEEGNCHNYTIKWFYNNKQKDCNRFWYGGCGGNKNRFDTRKECETLCLKSAS
ncbi:collagen alpha-3(VI) chain-like [Stegostoma tigrinum]|uniref:collagen alpha-3(VI) chain-like n=1 Tax=Stegostoma tigrinum TaxID=3053191 RepID=UPI00202B29CA|nr:collagen alpha-3(VI) chain-like [Stegostoma tigrinum]XP_048408580.1 collagen alpha-3(VI) chain-like [Stegostoma tigrinum]